MGHAIYSVSDPRAEIFKKFVAQLAHEKGYDKEYALYEKVEHMAPEIIAEKRKMYKAAPEVQAYGKPVRCKNRHLHLPLYTSFFFRQ